MGRPLTRTIPQPAPTADLVVSFEYDLAGRATVVSDSAGRTNVSFDNGTQTDYACDIGNDLTDLDHTFTGGTLDYAPPGVDDPMLVVVVGGEDDFTAGFAEVTGVSFGATAMTEGVAAQIIEGSDAEAGAIYYLANPGTAEERISVTYSANADDQSIIAMTLSGVKAQAPEAAASATSPDSEDHVAVSLTAATPGSVVITAGVAGNGDYTAGTGGVNFHALAGEISPTSFAMAVSFEQGPSAGLNYTLTYDDSQNIYVYDAANRLVAAARPPFTRSLTPTARSAAARRRTSTAR